jgi:hypothetical protein
MKLLKLTLCILTGLIPAVTVSGVERPVCAVVGFVNELKNEQWRDARVGMGVRAMLAQSLHGSGLFRMLDEKDEIAQVLGDISGRAWKEKRGGKEIDKAVKTVAAEGARFVASGRIFYFGKPRAKASVGPMHFSSDEVLIKLEVQLYDVQKKKKLKAIGVGKAKTTASSALFTFHDDRLDADKTMVATATRKAITAAVDEVIKRYREKYKVK